MTTQKTPCPYDPSVLVGIPMGQFHCPICGEMIIAGVPHLDYSLLDDLDDSDTSDRVMGAHDGDRSNRTVATQLPEETN